MRQQLSIAMGFTELCGLYKEWPLFEIIYWKITGVDSSQLAMSLSSAWHHRWAYAEQIACHKIEVFVEAVAVVYSRILVQFDKKDIEHDLDDKIKSVRGSYDIKVEKKNRLMIVFYSPCLQREQGMRAIPMDGKSGKIITNHSKITFEK